VARNTARQKRKLKSRKKKKKGSNTQPTRDLPSRVSAAVLESLGQKAREKNPLQGEEKKKGWKVSFSK
jgi:hypothetical protein